MDLIPISSCEEELPAIEEFNGSDTQELPMAIEDLNYLRPSTSTEEHSENIDQNKGREKRLREEEEEDDDETEWTVVKNKEKRYKPQNKKIELYVSCPEKLPKQFSLAKLLKNNDIGDIERIKYVNPYKIRLEMSDEMNAEKLEKCKEFSDRGWHVQRPFENNLSYGVIRNVDLDISDEEILKSISCPSPAVLVSIHRLKRRTHNDDNSSTWNTSECVRLCFKGAYLPTYVAVDGLKIRVEPYVFPVSQCSRCWKLGHATKKCPSTKVVCPKCGGNHANCETTAFKCVNCKGNHMSLVKTCPAFKKEKRLRDIMAEYNCTYRRALMIYVPPKEDKKTDDYNKVNVPRFFSTDDNLFPKLPTPRAMPVFSQTTVETEADIHEEEGGSCPKTPLRPKRARRRKEGVFDFGFQFTKEDEPKENVESEKKEDRDRGKFSDLLSRLKEILFLRGVSFQSKVNGVIKSCAEWLISVVVQYIPDWPIIKVLLDYLMNNG